MVKQHILVPIADLRRALEQRTLSASACEITVPDLLKAEQRATAVCFTLNSMPPLTVCQFAAAIYKQKAVGPVKLSTYSHHHMEAVSWLDHYRREMIKLCETAVVLAKAEPNGDWRLLAMKLTVCLFFSYM